MKIIILIEKYGGNCNRLFQSLHFHSLAIEENSKFINLSLLGNLRYDNQFFKLIDYIKNYILKLISITINIFTKRNLISIKLNSFIEISIVRGWDFRREELTKKHWKKLKNIYRFKKKFNKKYFTLKNKIEDFKSQGKYIVGLHIRRGDYQKWNKGIFYFDDNFYKKIIAQIKLKLITCLPTA